MTERNELQGRNAVFEKMPVHRAIAYFSIPSILSQIGLLVLSLADTFFIGQTGDPAQIAAMTVVFPLTMLMQCFVMVFSVGVSPRVAGAVSTGSIEKAKSYASSAFWIGMAAAAVYAAVLFAAFYPLMSLMSIDTETMIHTRQYLFWVVLIGSVPFGAYQVLFQQFLAEGRPRTAGAAGTVVAVLNIIMDGAAVLVLHMGIRGVAMATCAANSIGALILLLVYFASQKNSVISLSWRYFRPGGGVITSVAELGLPVALMILCTICCDFIRIRFLSALGGVEQVAAWGICTKICNAIMQINTGIASGVRPLCAYNFAAGNRIRTQEVIRTTLIITMIFNAVCVLILECFPQTAAAFFTDNVSVSARASVYLRCYIVSALGIGLNEVTAALLQATERWKLSLSAAFINKAVLLNGGTWIAGMLFGIPGIVVSQSVTESMAAAILLFLERATRFSHARK